MTALYSARWYRIAALAPRLSPRLQVRRQIARGQTWYLLSQRGETRSVRLNAAAYAIAGRFDGQHTLEQLWHGLVAGPHDPPTQDEVLELLTQLREASLVQVDQHVDQRVNPQAAAASLERAAQPALRNSVLAWRLRLADPSALLARLAWAPRLLFSPLAGALWVLAVLHLLAQALQHAPALLSHGATWLGTPRYAVLALLLYVPIKLVHELAHALAVQRWGGAVREAGVTLMLGLPAPWLDASAANAFERRQRIVVGAAGMMAELALAAFALPLWLALPDGLLRDAAFVTLFICGVSTLLFNANPLQRLDGYYIATDALALPNLATRSRQWWLDALRRRVLRLPGLEPLPTARGERPWLVAYAPLAWCSSLLIACVAVLWLGQLSLLLGLVGAALLAWQVALRPAVSVLGTLGRAAQSQQATAQRWRRLAWAAAAVAVLALAVPLPDRARVQGVVWPADQAQLRTEEDGFVGALSVRDGQLVQPGELLLQLVNPALETQLIRQQARAAALEAELLQALPGAARSADTSGHDARAGDAQAELGRAQAELARLQERTAALAVRAHAAGRVALPQASDLRGRYLKRGSLIGQVLGDQPARVRVALPESEAGELRREVRAVSVRLSATPLQAHAASLLRDGAGAQRQLPSAALSQRHGGPVKTDPASKDDLLALQPVVLLDVRLADGAAALPRLGERAWVRFDLGWSPLACQLAQGAQRALTGRFNPQL